MTQLTNWIKSNPLAVICLLVIALSLASFYWPTYVHSSEFREEMADRNSQVQQLRAYNTTSVVIPPQNPDDPPTQLRMVVNQSAINKLQNIYKTLETEYTGIYEWAQQRNVAGHQVMLTGLFPRPIDEAKPFKAREAYVTSFYNLYQSMDAGSPPGDEEIAEMLAREEELLRSSYLIPPGGALNETQQEELTRRQARKLFELYSTAASEYHVYADPIQVDPRTYDWSSAGVFQLGTWAKPGRKPDMFDIWEGQMQLWIQQDLVKAINIANDVTNPETSLIELPVKRIVSMVVKPNYVGAPESGFVWPQPGPVAEDMAKTRIEEIQQQLNQKLPDNFTASPTGRASNPIYDVRHAVLTVIVDSQQIPQVLNAIAAVNFMTVIDMKLNDVDEYEELRNGYYYGQVDAVKLDLTVETVWLRSWTAGHLSEEIAAARNERFYEGIMPDEVRYFLGLPPRNRDFMPRTDRTRDSNSYPGSGSGSYPPGSYPPGGAAPGSVPYDEFGPPPGSSF